MKQILAIALILSMSACASLPGVGTTINISDTKIQCINSADTSYESNLNNIGFATQGINYELSDSGLLFSKDEITRRKYHLVIDGNAYHPIWVLSYVEFFFAMATAFIIPAYHYKSYVLNIKIYENNELITELSAQDSVHNFVSLFAAFEKPDSSVYPSTVEIKVGRRLTRKAIDALICN